MSTLRSRQQETARLIAEQAAEWLLILEEDRQADREAFTDWLRESPIHVKSFLHASAVDALMNGVDPGRTLPIDPGPFDDEPDIRWRGRALTCEPQARGGFLRFNLNWLGGRRIAVAGVMLAAGLVGAYFATDGFEFARWTHYATAVGEQRLFPLEDGSVLRLNPGSRAAVLYSAKERRIRLVTGEALFKVSRDSARPFRVHSGGAVIQALGTEFSVLRRRDTAVVSVLEGVVQVSQAGAPAMQSAAPRASPQPVRLSAGQEVRLANDGTISKPVPSNPDRADEWRSKRLVFMNESLETIAEEFNRYNVRPKIKIEGPAAQLRFMASFEADEPESLMGVLKMNPALKVEERGGVFVVSQR